MHKQESSKSSFIGFTMIELLIVITIIAVLSTIGLITYSGIQARARDAKRRSDINSIAQAWEVHASRNSPNYPVLVGTFFSNEAVPTDPINSGTFVYDYSGGAANTTTAGDNYRVCANLETGGNYCQSSSN